MMNTEDINVIRRRTKKGSNIIQSSPIPHADRTDYVVDDGASGDARRTDAWITKRCYSVLMTTLGFNVMCLIAGAHIYYVYSLHENSLWFSNIDQIEREISFRTESGLYYSYFKQLIDAPTISQGIYELMNDNVTEHLRTINVLSRFNIYQELFMAIIYRTIPVLQTLFEPILFYIYTIFHLHGMLVASLFGMTWIMSKSWLAGLLTACFYIFNKADTTRVDYVIPLRESFSLPFLWTQLALITLYFRPTASYTQQRSLIVAIWLATFAFSITWQFNQFILLLQAMALFGMQVLQLIPFFKLCHIYAAQVGCLFLVALLQFANTMLLTGFIISFIPAACLVMYIQSVFVLRPGIMRRLAYICTCIILVFVFTFTFKTLIQILVNQDADEHIYKFLMTKFELGNYESDFDVRLYLCNGAFGFLDWDTLVRLTANLTLPLYVCVHIVAIIALLIAQVQLSRYESQGSPRLKQLTMNVFSRRPEFAFHVILAAFHGVVAMTTLRLKYLWTPYICIFAGMAAADHTSWSWILRKWNCGYSLLIDCCRGALTCLILVALLLKCVPEVQRDLKILKEFWDPDTVKLMQWIKTDTAPNAAFTGSMQLLAGVKLCTGRPLTNHPHYEDKQLRERTKELYQMYGRWSAVDIHAVMLKYNVSYMILEDSICMASSSDNCGIPHIMDGQNGDVSEHKGRFCNEIRHGRAPHSKFFKSVFENKTFRVYKIIPR